MNGGRPKVSLGMPVFNAERYLTEALDSILDQSVEGFELVICDNASNDGTEEICRAYAQRDSRIRYFRNRVNVGLVENFNRVFTLSSGKYFRWSAADDVCGRDLLKRTVDVLDSDPEVVLAWVGTEGIDEDGNMISLTPANRLSDLNSDFSTYSPDPVVRFRRVMRNIWWVDPPFYSLMRAETLANTALHRPHVSGDQLLVSEMALRGRFYEIDELLFFNRIHHPEKSSRARTRRERAVLLEQDPRKKRFLLPKLFWLYVRRVAAYFDMIQDAPLTPIQRRQCQLEVAYAVARWLRRPGKGGY